jgi:starch synthase
MHVVLLLKRFFAAGQTTHVVDLARSLSSAGHQVTLISTSSSASGQFGQAYTRDLYAAGVSVALSEPGAPLPPGVSRPNIIHAHSSLDFGWAEDLSRRLRLPFVLTLHGLGITHLLAAGPLRRAAAVIAVGRRVAAEALTLTPKVVIIENAVDTHRFRPSEHEGATLGCLPPLHPPTARPATPFTVLYAGRIDPERRQCFRDVAWAASLLADRRPVRLIVLAVTLPRLSVGHGGNHDELIDFRGWQWDPSPVYREADVVAGSGRVIREGLASGRPCLLAGQAYSGIVFPRALDPTKHDFSARGTSGHPVQVKRILGDLTHLAADPKLGRDGRAYALAHLGLERATATTIGVYQRVLDAPPQPMSRMGSPRKGKNPSGGGGLARLGHWRGRLHR